MPVAHIAFDFEKKQKIVSGVLAAAKLKKQSLFYEVARHFTLTNVSVEDAARHLISSCIRPSSFYMIGGAVCVAALASDCDLTFDNVWRQHCGSIT